MTEIWKLEGNEISKLFKSRKISCKEIINSFEERFYEVNPKINAIPEETFDYAKKRAETLDKKLIRIRILQNNIGIQILINFF